MNLYLLVKWLHIVSSVLMVGTGLGSAFYLFFIIGIIKIFSVCFLIVRGK